VREVQPLANHRLELVVDAQGQVLRKEGQAVGELSTLDPFPGQNPKDEIKIGFAVFLDRLLPEPIEIFKPDRAKTLVCRS
jgi:hypothetical protein